jgi:transposase
MVRCDLLIFTDFHPSTQATRGRLGQEACRALLARNARVREQPDPGVVIRHERQKCGLFFGAAISAGNVAEITMAPALVADLSARDCGTLVADKGYDSDALRSLLVEKDIFPCLARNATRKETRPFHRGYYRKRHHVENFFSALKRHRRVSTRYEKLATSFAAFVTMSHRALDRLNPFYKHSLGPPASGASNSPNRLAAARRRWDI